MLFGCSVPCSLLVVLVGDMFCLRSFFLTKMKGSRYTPARFLCSLSIGRHLILTNERKKDFK